MLFFEGGDGVYHICSLVLSCRADVKCSVCDLLTTGAVPCLLQLVQQCTMDQEGKINLEDFRRFVEST